MFACETMRIRWHGHACFEVSDGATVITDPHDGVQIGLPPPSVKGDIVLVSHNHFDHNCSNIVKGGPKIVKTAGDFSERGIQIKGVDTFHDEAEGAKRGKNIMFKFVMDGISFLHAGDLGHSLSGATAQKLGNVDILFVPVGGIFTVGPDDAWKVVNAVKPKVTVPMHFRTVGLNLSIQPVEPFLSKAKKDCMVRVGNEHMFEKSDLPNQMELWVFSL